MVTQDTTLLTPTTQFVLLLQRNTLALPPLALSLLTTMTRIRSYGDPEGCGYCTPDLAVSLKKHSKNSLVNAFQYFFFFVNTAFGNKISQCLDYLSVNSPFSRQICSAWATWDCTLVGDVVTRDTQLTFLCRADLLVPFSDAGKTDNIIRGFQLNVLPVVLILSIK